MSLITMGAIMGTNVRVGLEDNLYISAGVKATSNAEQVRKIRRILGELSIEIATPTEVRELLQLKGRENVHFASSPSPGRPQEGDAVKGQSQ
jgi:uncharacterized protein (DUF849 family)